MIEPSAHDFASVLPHVERLAERGNLLRLPTSRARGDGLFELRFDVLRVAWGITYFRCQPRPVVDSAEARGLTIHCDVRLTRAS